MYTAAQRGRLRPTANFVLIVALSSLFSPAAFGQQGEAKKKRSVGEQIQELVVDLERRESALEELRQTIDENPDGAAAMMLEKELSPSESNCLTGRYSHGV